MSDLWKLGGGAAIVAVLAAWNIHGGGVAGGSPQRAQEKLQESARVALAGVGADWASVKMVGQRADIQGTAPTEEELLIARGAVRTAAGSGGWLLGGVTAVRSDAARVWTARQGPYPWSADVDLSRVRLAGSAPTREIAQELGELAGALFTDRRVVNELTVDPLPPDDGWEEAARGALAVLSHVDVGEARLADFELAVSGQAASQAQAEAASAALERLVDARLVSAVSQARVAAAAPPPAAPAPAPAPAAPATFAPSAATSAPRPTEGPAADCQADVDRALARDAIVFDAGSASLSAQADPALDALAAAARACAPLALRIEGHTDDTGVPALNRSLSERRARAVLERLSELGVERARMTAVGLGAAPVGEGATPDRRIEIIVGP